MIKITIATDGEKVLDSVETKDTTLLENSIVLRRLEQIKQELLDIGYDNDREVTHGIRG